MTCIASPVPQFMSLSEAEFDAALADPTPANPIASNSRD